MRIKQVSQKTGLTEKTIRFYIKEQLITPEVSLGDHYHSYQFSTEDVQRLKNISALRSIGIGISDIRDILTHPELPRRFSGVSAWCVVRLSINSCAR